MGIFEDIIGTAGKVIQKPQSIAMGLVNEVGGSADNMRDFMRKYEYGLVDDTEENSMRYEEAKQMVGDSELNDDPMLGGLLDPTQLVEGVKQGFQGNIRPSDISQFETENDQGLASKIGNPIADVVADPLMFAGGLGKAATAGTALAKPVASATTFGKLAEGASKTDKAAQAARYLYQGSMAGGGNPMLGLGISGLMPLAERGVGRVASRFISKAGTEIADDLVGQGTESAMSRQGIDQVENEYRKALQVLGQDMPEAKMAMGAVEGDDFMMKPPPGELELWQPNPMTQPMGEVDDVVAQARQYMQINPDATTSDLLYDIEGVRKSNVRDIMAQAKEGMVDTTRVPYSERGAMFNQRLMEDGMPNVNPAEQLALPPGQQAIPLPSESATGVNARNELQSMLAREVPDQSPAWPVELFGPKPKMLGAGRPMPVPDTLDIPRVEMPAASTPMSLSPQKPKAIGRKPATLPRGIDEGMKEQLAGMSQEEVNSLLDEARRVAKSKKITVNQAVQEALPKQTPVATAVKESVAPKAHIPGNLSPEIKDAMGDMTDQQIAKVLFKARQIARKKNLPQEAIIEQLIDEMAPKSDDALFNLLKGASQG